MSKRDRVCGKKCKHKTEQSAWIQAKKAVKVGFNVYQCPKCKYWHIGKSRSPTRSAERITALLEKHARQLEARNKHSEKIQ